MELLVDHLKAVVTVLTESAPDFRRFIDVYKAIKEPLERQALLRVTLQLDKFDLPKSQPISDEYSSGAILTEQLQDALEFALNEGFTYSELGAFLNLYLQVLTLVIQENSSEVSASKMQEKLKTVILEYADKLRHAHILSSVSFIRNTILRHLRLYHYLLTQEQPQDLTIVKLDLPSPSLPLPLKDAQQEQEWACTQRIATLKSKQDKEEKELLKSFESTSQKEEQRLQDVYKTQLSKITGQAEVSEEDVKSLVESLATAHLQSTKVSLSKTLQRQNMLLEMKTEELEMLSSESAFICTIKEE